MRMDGLWIYPVCIYLCRIFSERYYGLGWCLGALLIGVSGGEMFVGCRL